MTIERLVIAALILIAVFAVWKVAGMLLRRRHVGRLVGERGSPTILYFTTDDCAQCKGQQQPELNRLTRLEPAVVVRQIDAVAERDLASRFDVMTVPSTVVVGADGVVRAVNYGLASHEKLRRQLAV